MIGLLRTLGLAPARQVVEAQTQLATLETRVQEARKEGFQRGQQQYLGYAAGNLNSRTVNFSALLESANREIKRDLRALRAHSRTLSRDNAFQIRYLQLCVTHIVGPNGITFDSVLMGYKGKPQKDRNDAVKDAWKAWGKDCSVDGLPWTDFEQLVLTTVAKDGEAFVRKVFGFANPFGFALELIDADRVDWTYTVAPSKSQNEVVMGVEIDKWGRKVAFWIWSAHPTDLAMDRKRVRIPADQIIHIGRHDRARGTRFIPWATGVMTLLNLVGRYWNSEITAANSEADRMGFFYSEAGDMDTSEGGQDLADPTTVQVQSDVATFYGLPAGVKVQIPTIQHPNTAFDTFSKAMLRGIASGLGVAYHSLTGDVGAANYSSARVALLEERDNWRKLQGWFVRSFHDKVFPAWIDMACLSGQIELPVSDPGLLCAPKWYPRGWEWIDPEKDANSSKASIGGGFTTLQKVCAEQGDDWQEVLDQRAIEQDYAKEKGLFLDYTTKGAMPPQEAAAESPSGAEAETKDTPTANGGQNA